jgi:hypothetical protein
MTQVQGKCEITVRTSGDESLTQGLVATLRKRFGSSLPVESSKAVVTIIVLTINLESVLTLIFTEVQTLTNDDVDIDFIDPDMSD